MTAVRPDSWPEFLISELKGGTIGCRFKPRIVIGVCTRGRNTLLRRLIKSINNQPVPTAYDVEIVVVDNNDQPQAAAALADQSNRFRLHIVHQSRSGLVFARNRALDEAVARGAVWFIGVDDDEWVAPDWLANFISGLDTMGEQIVLGPCRNVYDDQLSPFLKPKRVPATPRGARPPVLGTGNFAIHQRVFDATFGPGLRFDPTYNESGGEDLDFFLRAEHLCGWVAAWLPDACVYEDWNGVRATLRYGLARNLRSQLLAYQVAGRHRKLGYYGSRFGNLATVFLRLNRNVIYGTGYLIAGVALLPFRLRPARHLIGNALEAGARAGAVLPLLLGKKPVAYGPRAEPVTL